MFIITFYLRIVETSPAVDEVPRTEQNCTMFRVIAMEVSSIVPMKNVARKLHFKGISRRSITFTFSTGRLANKLILPMLSVSVLTRHHEREYGIFRGGSK